MLNLFSRLSASSLVCVGMLCTLNLTGCSDAVTTTKVKSTAEKPESLLKTRLTKEVGEFKAGEGKAQVNSEVKYSNPITGALEAYDPMKQQIAEGQVKQAVEMFRATEGRYPRDYAEFKSKVIGQYGLKVPTLGVGKRYEYDVENHKLIVVMDKKE